jgi:hypothetical protein
MSDLLTNWRHLFAAVLVLGADEGAIDERLQQAYRGALSRISRNPGLPIHLFGEFEALMKDIEDLYATPGDVETKRASQLAKRVVALYDRITKQL